MHHPTRTAQWLLIAILGIAPGCAHAVRSGSADFVPYAYCVPSHRDLSPFPRDMGTEPYETPASLAIGDELPRAAIGADRPEATVVTVAGIDAGRESKAPF